MPAPFFPDIATLDDAATRRTELALSVVRLFKTGFSPGTTVTKAQLEANEADYSTYAEATITAWLPPILSSYGGAQITAPAVQFALAADPAVPNTIGGWWLENAGGEVKLVQVFDNPKSMVKAFDGFSITPTIVMPNGQ